MSEFENPFPSPYQEPCDNNECTPCLSTAAPDSESCLVCGYPHNAFEECRSQATPCLNGSVECLNCEDSFSDTKFLGGHIAGFSSKLGYGASESTVTIDLVVLKNNNCPSYSDSCVTTVPSPDFMSCVDDVYTGNIGHVYTFSLGGYCFRGILANHNYTEDTGGFRYKVTLTDGRSVLAGCVVLLNGIYDPVPEKLQSNLINIIRELEPSVYDDQCANFTKCTDYMMSGADLRKGIFIKKALIALDGKCVTVPISKAGLTLNLSRLINVVSDDIRTTNQESTVLELISLACEESGYDFFAKINNDNEIEIIPINYKIDPSGTDLFEFVENLSNTDIIISKDYGQEMTFEKNKKIVFGSEYCYLTTIRDWNKQIYCADIPDPPNPQIIGSYDQSICSIFGAPWQQPNVRNIFPDGPILSSPSGVCP